METADRADYYTQQYGFGAGMAYSITSLPVLRDVRMFFESAYNYNYDTGNQIGDGYDRVGHAAMAVGSLTGMAAGAMTVSRSMAQQAIRQQARQAIRVSAPRTALAEAEGFIGPGIGRSGYRTMAEFDAAVGARYQQLVDQGYAQTMRRVSQGLVKNDPMVIGSEVDTFARTGMRRWLANVEGIQEGPGQIIRINRRLYDPTGSGAFRIPDVYVPGARSVYDATIAEKTIFFPQTIDFRAFSGGGNVTIVRPSTLVTPGAQGSYGLFFL